MSNVLVTGGSGFVGSALCGRLHNLGHKVFAVGNNLENKPDCHRFLPINLDGFHFNSLPDIDVCFHQAAHNDTTDPDDENMQQANFRSPASLFYRLEKEKNCKKYVYASSASVYGNLPTPHSEDLTSLQPLNAYAKSKFNFEEFAKDFAKVCNVSVVGLRYTNVFGPGEMHKGKRASMINQLLHTIWNGEFPVLFRDGTQRRDWVYIDDVVEANLRAWEYPNSGIFNVGSGEDISFNEIVTVLNQEYDRNYPALYIDCPFLEAYQSHTLADLTKSKKELGYSPKYTIREGIKKFVWQEIERIGQAQREESLRLHKAAGR